MKITIGKNNISDNSPTFIIAEAGVNHDCILERGFALIDEAAKAGANAIKFQTYKAEKLATKSAKKYWCDGAETQFENYKKLDFFGFEEYKKLKERCEEKGIVFLSTPFDIDSVDLLENLDVQAYKIASADITNFPLLEKIAATKKPVFLATGAATIKEIKEAVALVKKKGNNKIALLHCILCYPTPIEFANLRFIETLKKEFPNMIIGISDHSKETITAVIAAALGAKIIEKHFTIDKSISGSSDHPISVDPVELKEMVAGIRLAERTLGAEKLARPIEIEKSAHLLARRSIVAIKKIKKGEKFTLKNIDFLRPGTGISPKHYRLVLGKKAKKEILDGELIRFGMF